MNQAGSKGGAWKFDWRQMGVLLKQGCEKGREARAALPFTSYTPFLCARLSLPLQCQVGFGSIHTVSFFLILINSAYPLLYHIPTSGIVELVLTLEGLTVDLK